MEFGPARGANSPVQPGAPKKGCLKKPKPSFATGPPSIIPSATDEEIDDQPEDDQPEKRNSPTQPGGPRKGCLKKPKPSFSTDTPTTTPSASVESIDDQLQDGQQKKPNSPTQPGVPRKGCLKKPKPSFATDTPTTIPSASFESIDDQPQDGQNKKRNNNMVQATPASSEPPVGLKIDLGPATSRTVQKSPEPSRPSNSPAGAMTSPRNRKRTRDQMMAANVVQDGAKRDQASGPCDAKKPRPLDGPK